MSHDSPIRDYTTRHLFRPLHLFFMLPLAAFLRVTDLSSAVVRKQLVPTNPSALVVGLVTCIVTLLILALLATRNRSEEKKPMLVPGIFCLIVSLAISLGTTLTPQSILANILSGIPMTPLPPTMFASVILVGVGITLFTVAWAHAYQSLDRDTIFVNTAIAFALANALDGTLARFATDMDPLVVAASLVLLSALPLELILSGGKGDGGTGLGQGNGASGTVGQGDGAKCPTNPSGTLCPVPLQPQAGAFGAFLRSSWKPYAGLMLCWVITACTWGTALGTDSPSGASEVNPIKQMGGMFTGVMMVVLFLALANRKASFRLVLRFLPVSATALLLLSWFLVLMNPVLGILGQLLLGVSLGLLTMLTWTEFSHHAAQTHATDSILGKAGALLLAAMLGAGVLAYLLKDAAEFVSPVLMLGYLVLVNFNFGTNSGTVTPDDVTPNMRPNKQVERFAKTYRLTPRECEIAGYLANGLSAPYIADALFISHNSVKTHARHIYHKAGVHKRDELIALINTMNDESPE